MYYCILLSLLPLLSFRPSFRYNPLLFLAFLPEAFLLQKSLGSDAQMIPRELPLETKDGTKRRLEQTYISLNIDATLHSAKLSLRPLEDPLTLSLGEQQSTSSYINAFRTISGKIIHGASSVIGRSNLKKERIAPQQVRVEVLEPPLSVLATSSDTNDGPGKERGSLQRIMKPETKRLAEQGATQRQPQHCVHLLLLIGEWIAQQYSPRKQVCKEPKKIATNMLGGAPYNTWKGRNVDDLLKKPARKGQSEALFTKLYRSYHQAEIEMIKERNRRGTYVRFLRYSAMLAKDKRPFAAPPTIASLAYVTPEQSKLQQARPHNLKVWKRSKKRKEVDTRSIERRADTTSNESNSSTDRSRNGPPPPALGSKQRADQRKLLKIVGQGLKDNVQEKEQACAKSMKNCKDALLDLSQNRFIGGVDSVRKLRQYVKAQEKWEKNIKDSTTARGGKTSFKAMLHHAVGPPQKTEHGFWGPLDTKGTKGNVNPGVSPGVNPRMTHDTSSKPPSPVPGGNTASFRPPLQTAKKFSMMKVMGEWVIDRRPKENQEVKKPRDPRREKTELLRHIGGWVKDKEATQEKAVAKSRAKHGAAVAKEAKKINERFRRHGGGQGRTFSTGSLSELQNASVDAASDVAEKSWDLAFRRGSKESLGGLIRHVVDKPRLSMPPPPPPRRTPPQTTLLRTPPPRTPPPTSPSSPPRRSSRTGKSVYRKQD